MKILLEPAKAKLYSYTWPEGSVIIGTITTETQGTGMLVKLPTGIYVKVNAGLVQTLSQNKVKKILHYLRKKED
jgi:hypothetical protein